MLSKPLKIIAWTAGTLVGVAGVLYLAAVAVNLRDRPPSVEAIRLTALYETRPSLPDEDNAFVYLLGFEAPTGDDPRDLGTRRLAWLQQSATTFDSADDPQTTRLGYASNSPIVEAFLAACGSDTRECAVAFDDAGTVFEAWNTTNPWLLERYLALIAHSGWREVVLDVSHPLPNYAPAINGQRFLLLRAKLLADGGDVDAATELLSSDVRFWRTVLASSDLLITKMIAASALRQHFEWGNLAMRRSPAARAGGTTPGEWRQPMTPDELSLRRTLAGEWMYFTNFPLVPSPALSADTLLLPFYQPQDTLNLHAAYLSRIADALDAPLPGYARAADDAAEWAQRTADEAFPPRSLYNWFGSLLITAGRPDYAPYARRVADLEGIRRAALAAVTLRDTATPVSEVAAALAASPLRNPYDDQPLTWDAEAQAIVFVGLEPGKRGEHRFFY